MKDVHHRCRAVWDVALCGSDLLVACVGAMGTDSKDQTSFINKYAVTLKPMPDEYTQQHARIKWWDHLIVRIANVPGLTQVANDLTPAPVSAIVDVSLDDAPHFSRHPIPATREDSSFVHAQRLKIEPI